MSLLLKAVRHRQADIAEPADDAMQYGAQPVLKTSSIEPAPSAATNTTGPSHVWALPHFAWNQATHTGPSGALKVRRRERVLLASHPCTAMDWRSRDRGSVKLPAPRKVRKNPHPGASDGGAPGEAGAIQRVQVPSG